MLRWTAIIGSVLLIVIGVWILIYPHPDLAHPLLAGTSVIVFGLLAFTTALGNLLARYISAVLLGGCLTIDCIMQVVNYTNQHGIADLIYSKEIQRAFLRFLLFAIPCLLYVFRSQKILRRYCSIVFGIFFVVGLPHAIAKLFGASGWTYALFHLPLILIVLAWGITSLYFVLRDRKRGWRMNPQSYGHWTYEERIGNEWQTIQLECMGDHREPPISILLPRMSAWENFPSWSRERHAEIMQRIVGRLNDSSLTLIDPETNLPVPKLQ